MRLDVGSAWRRHRWFAMTFLHQPGLTEPSSTSSDLGQAGLGTTLTPLLGCFWVWKIDAGFDRASRVAKLTSLKIHPSEVKTTLKVKKRSSIRPGGTSYRLEPPIILCKHEASHLSIRSSRVEVATGLIFKFKAQSSRIFVMIQVHRTWKQTAKQAAWRA